jgi:hypothetical protein
MQEGGNELIAHYGTAADENASPALPPATYVGTYSNDYMGQVRVVADGVDLMLALGAGGKITRRLTHFDRDTFTVYAAPESPKVPFPLVFSIDRNGKETKATALTILLPMSPYPSILNFCDPVARDASA